MAGNDKLNKTQKILFVVNVDWFFLSHRLPIALAAKDAGFEVWVAAADTGDGEKIESFGLHFIDIPFSRKGTNILSEIRLFPKLFRLYKKLNPELVHHVTIKPVLFGSIVARLFRRIHIVNAITGLGFTFSKDTKAKSLAWGIQRAYKLALGNPRQVTIFQNPDDLNHFVQNNLIKDKQAVIIKGSGVDCSVFKPSKDHVEGQLILLASRMIQDKGIYEFVEAAEIVKKQKPNVRFVLAGMSDDGNPNAIPVHQLESWTDEGIVEWVGYREEMVSLIQQSSMVVLPTTYPEGVPKILIEAAACGKPIITSDRPGCREIVTDRINGFLIDPGDSSELASTILTLLNDPELGKKYGGSGRERVLNEFSEEIVIEKTLALYRRMMMD